MTNFLHYGVRYHLCWRTSMYWILLYFRYHHTGPIMSVYALREGFSRLAEEVSQCSRLMMGLYNNIIIFNLSRWTSSIGTFKNLLVWRRDEFIQNYIYKKDIKDFKCCLLYYIYFFKASKRPLILYWLWGGGGYGV